MIGLPIGRLEVVQRMEETRSHLSGELCEIMRVSLQELYVGLMAVLCASIDVCHCLMQVAQGVHRRLLRGCLGHGSLFARDAGEVRRRMCQHSGRLGVPLRLHADQREFVL